MNVNAQKQTISAKQLRHILSGPLAVIRTHSGLTRLRNPEIQDIKELDNLIKQQTEYMTRVFEDLEAIQKFESGEFVAGSEPVILNNVLADLSGEYSIDFESGEEVTFFATESHVQVLVTRLLELATQGQSKPIKIALTNTGLNILGNNLESRFSGPLQNDFTRNSLALRVIEIICQTYELELKVTNDQISLNVKHPAEQLSLRR